MSDYQCWQCGEALTAMIFPVSRREECAKCRAEIHVCRMCQHFRAERHDWCVEDRAEPPSAPDRANFCDYYAITSGAYGGDAQSATDKALDQLSDLFD